MFTTATAHARIGLVAGEPFGSFGTMMPEGHASVYLDDICPDTPTRVRLCQPGEHGSVVSRFHDLYNPSYDWLATPAIPFFYGVEQISDVPAFVTPQFIGELRERYREQHLAEVVPARADRHGRLHPPPYGDWSESIGATFDRRILLYMIDTTPAQDAAIINFLNGSPNKRRYTLRRRNCADFAADVLSVVVPGVQHRNFFGDFDMMTPKQLARTMNAYGHAHPELHPQVLDLPQLAGTTRRSRPLRGAAESFITTKRYFAAVLVLQPELLLADWILYRTKDHWTAGLDAQPLTPGDWLQPSLATNTPAGAGEASTNDP